MCASSSFVLGTWIAGNRERLYGAEPGRCEDARARMSTEEAPADTAEEVVEEDLRTLWIDRDDQGHRFKELKNVCSESSEERQADSPVAGPLSCLVVRKQMQHHGGNPQVVDACVDEGARCER